MRLRLLKRRTLAWGLAFLLLLAVLVVVRMPAVVAWQGLLADSPGLRPLKLTGLDGTVWHGRAARLSYGRLQAGPLRWQLDFLPLLWGELSTHAQLAVPDGEVTGQLVLSGDALTVEDLHLQLPLGFLAPLMYGSPFVPAGAITGEVNAVVIAPGQVCQAEGELLWRSPGVAGVEGLDLGDIQLELEGDGTGTRGVVRDRGGSLGVDGTLLVEVNCRYKLDVRLTPRGEISDPLRRMLGFLGRADAQGRYRLRLQGQLPVR